MIKDILCVDDDEIVLVANSALIKYLWPEASVSTASNGQMALDFFNSVSSRGAIPQVLLLDLDMPQMNGWEFLEKFEPLFMKRFPDLYIAIHSSNISDLEISMAETHPMVRKFIPKPLTHEALEDILNEYQK